jgi:hypothetical protein
MGWYLKERPLGGKWMKFLRTALIGFICMVFLISSCVGTGSLSQSNEQVDPSKLLVVWTSGDRDVAMNMVFMYTYNAKKSEWWENIRFIVWGASTKLLSGDKELQQEILKMKDVGIEILVCKACADIYGVSEGLQKLGLEVRYLGKDLTDMLKSGWTTLTF